jgi:hypothetical protein
VGLKKVSSFFFFPFWDLRLCFTVCGEEAEEARREEEKEEDST